MTAFNLIDSKVREGIDQRCGGSESSFLLNVKKEKDICKHGRGG